MIVIQTKIVPDSYTNTDLGATQICIYTIHIPFIPTIGIGGRWLISTVCGNLECFWLKLNIEFQDM